ncbi:hypothetical protein, partial [Acinetobacter bereziniae]|uniref:hypothetical protein n=1 Tax=Acinetobacter bereziniae TaxID=106648 RepID=UPI001C2E8B3C
IRLFFYSLIRNYHIEFKYYLKKHLKKGCGLSTKAIKYFAPKFIILLKSLTFFVSFSAEE